VVESAVGGLIRAKNRDKRLVGVVSVSLNTSGRKSERADWAALLTPDDQGRRTGSVPVDERRRREDAEAVGRALSHMTGELRDLCRRIMGGSIAAVARDRGVSRRQIRKSLAEARPYLERAGFDSP
jgi:hypothetical protein